MIDPTRQEIAARSKTVVVKVGTRVLAQDNGTLDQSRVTAIAEQLVQLMEEGRHVVLVSSGAVGSGMGRLALRERPSDLAHLQAVAAVGQSRLIESYNRALEVHGRHAAQTLLAVFEYGALPIINENDTVRVDELQRNVGDNDRLAAMVTNLLRAPLLILLSDVEGLYDRHPSSPGAAVIPIVKELDSAIRDFQQQTPAVSGANHLSRGGMASKLEAARLATLAGENVVIANGRRPNVITDIVAGASVGTLFLAQGPAVTSRKRWIGLTAQPCGRLSLDAGAQQAIEKRGRSLLAIGVKLVEGNFQKGDVISLCRENDQEFARGLTNYASDVLRRIAGRATEEIVKILGHCPYDEVVHRDNLVILS
jgi:glutamate 5-kinase